MIFPPPINQTRHSDIRKSNTSTRRAGSYLLFSIILFLLRLWFSSLLLICQTNYFAKLVYHKYIFIYLYIYRYYTSVIYIHDSTCMYAVLSFMHIYIYDSTSYIYHSPLKYKVPQWYVKCIRLLSIGNTIYAYLFIYVPQLYVYTIFPTIHMRVRFDSALEHHTIM